MSKINQLKYRALTITAGDIVMNRYFKCPNCGRKHPPGYVNLNCIKCGALLDDLESKITIKNNAKTNRPTKI